MFRRVGVVLVLVALCGACSARRVPQALDVPAIAEWNIMFYGAVEYVGDDHIVVRFYRFAIHGVPEVNPGFTQLDARSFSKLFRAFEPDQDGVGTNYPLFYRVGDSVSLVFSAYPRNDPEWLTRWHYRAVPNAPQSALPTIVGFRPGQRQ